MPWGIDRDPEINRGKMIWSIDPSSKPWIKRDSASNRREEIVGIFNVLRTVE